jgi:hypothetical protein
MQCNQHAEFLNVKPGSTIETGMLKNVEVRLVLYASYYFKLSLQAKLIQSLVLSGILSICEGEWSTARPLRYIVLLRTPVPSEWEAG